MKRWEIIKLYNDESMVLANLYEEERFAYKYSDTYQKELEEDIKKQQDKLTSIIKDNNLGVFELEAYRIYEYISQDRFKESIFDSSIFFSIIGYFSDEDLRFSSVMCAVRWAREKRLNDMEEEEDEA